MTCRNGPVAGPAIGDFGGGSFTYRGATAGWFEFGGQFWVHSLEGTSDGLALAAVVLALRKQARKLGHKAMYWQVYPETGGAMLATLGHGRARIDYVQMYCEA